MTIVTRLFHIQSDDLEVKHKGRILQTLVVLLTLLGWVYSAILPPVPRAETFPLLLTQGSGSLLLALVCLYLLRNGRLHFATHFFFLAQTLIQAIILNMPGGSEPFAYFMLVNVVAIAILDSPRISVLYAILITFAVLIYTMQSGRQLISFMFGYGIAASGISLTTWLTANSLQSTLKQSKQLAETLQENSRQLQAANKFMAKRTRQLQTAAETGQVAASKLNLPDILQETIHLIQDQFSYYYVAVYLLDKQQRTLVLQEASGSIGQQLKAEHFKLKLDTDHSIICWSANQRQARISHDVSQDPVYLMHPILEKTRSELAIPLIARANLIGVLDIQSVEPNAFHEDDVPIIQILANQTAVNINNAQLFTQIETRLNEMEALYTLNTLLTTTLDAGEIYRRGAISFSEYLDITHCTIYSWQTEQNTITSQIYFSSSKDHAESGAYRLQHDVYQLKPDSNTQRVLHTLEPLLHASRDPSLSASKRAQLQELQQDYCLEIPLVRGIEAVGLVELFRSGEQHEFNQTEIQFAQTAANQIANALHNAITASDSRARVAQLSTLNRFSNILALSPSLKAVFDGARREIMSLVEATGMSIILLDENEKMLNWVYGFEYGQDVDLSTVPPLSVEKGFSGYVIRNRELLHINRQIDELYQELQSTTVGAYPSSWLGLPLIVANKLIGVLAVENEHDDDAFLERDIELLQTIAGPLAIAINNLIQFNAVQAALAAQSEQRLQLQTAAAVAAATTSILDRQTLMEQAVTLIKERFNLYYVGLFLIDQTVQTAVLKAGSGEAGRRQLQKGHQLTVGGRSLIGGVTKDGQSRIIQDVSQDREWRPNPTLPDTKSELALPLKVRGQTIGALTVQSSETHAFGHELIATLQTMSDQLAVAIENALLLASAEARARQQQRLNEISASLYRSGDVGEIIRVGLQAISEELHGATVNLHVGRPANNGQQTR